MYDEDGNPVGGSESSSLSPWSWRDNKAFEEAIVTVPEDAPDRWLQIALRLPGKSPAEVVAHYDRLVSDVVDIDAGRVELPSYKDDNDDSSLSGFDSAEAAGDRKSSGSAKGKHGEAERKKGNPWTEAEHKLFLTGLKKYGKGDWRSISRNVVVTRTPTQVASHAQKFFSRQASGKKERKRSSIHDITTVDGETLANATATTALDHLVQPPAFTPMLPDNPTHSFQGDHMGFHGYGLPRQR